jgi:hypothetical protein
MTLNIYGVECDNISEKKERSWKKYLIPLILLCVLAAMVWGLYGGGK